MKMTFWTRNVWFGVLMAVVLVFGMQGTADALTLTPTSDRVQSNIENSEFEISFSVGLKSDTTQIKNNDGKLVNDGGTQRIDPQGYQVMVIDGKDYRTTTITAADSSASQLVPPTPNTPDRPSGLDLTNSSQDDYAAYAVFEKVSSSQYVSYDSAIFADSSKRAFSNRGYPLHYYTPAFMYDGSDADTDEDDTAPAKVSSQIKIRDEQFTSRTALSNRYHYNDEAIAISVTSGMTIRLKSSSTTYPVNIIDVPSSRPATPAALSTTTASLWESGGIRSLPSRITLVCTSSTAGTYTVTITDVSPANDFPANAPETLEQASITFTLYVEDDAAPTGSLNFNEATGSLLRLDTAKSIEPIYTHFDLTASTLANKSIRYKVTTGSGLLYVGTPTREDTELVSDLTIHKDAMVYLKVNQTDNEVVAAIAGQDLRTHGKTLVFKYTGADRRTTSTTGTTNQQQQQQQQVRTPSLSISVSGTGTTRSVTVTAINAQGTTVPGLPVTLSGSALTTSQVVTSGTPTTITIPSGSGTYTLQAVASGYTVGATSITVTAPGTLSLALVGTQVNGSQTVQVTARNAGGALETTEVRVTLSGAGVFRTLDVTGSQNVPIALPTTSGTLTVSAPGYTSGSVVLPARSTSTTTTTTTTPTTPPTPTPSGSTGVANSIQIDGARQISSTVNQATQLRVRVLDANNRGVSGVRVTFKVLAPGQGRLSQRGNGRATQVETDRNGYATAALTPLGGDIIVEAKAARVSAPVSFIIDVNGTLMDEPGTSSDTTSPREYTVGDRIPISLEDTLSFTGSRTLNGTTYTCTGPGACVISYGLVTRGEIRATATTQATPAKDATPQIREMHQEVLLGEGQRPPMVWVDSGGIYTLVGAEVRRLHVLKQSATDIYGDQSPAEERNIENAVDIAIHGNKLYWTEQIGANEGTINAANLDGSGATKLVEIRALPRGIAVDAAAQRLYWTNSAGWIQSSNLQGTARRNVVSGGLEDPMGIAVGNGSVYWTQGNGRVQAMNLTGSKAVRNIVTGTDAANDVAVFEGKVYWTEMTGRNAGTINSANLNGSGAKQLVSIKAVPRGIAVDAAAQRLYWTNSQGWIQSSNLQGTARKNVAKGLGSPGGIALSANIQAPTTRRTTPTPANYDVDGSGSVDNADIFLVALAVGTDNAKYDVNGDGTVDDKDIALVRDNRDDGAAGAPLVVGVKLTAEQVERLQAQIDLLIATGDRSPSAMRTLIYLQQLIATARPEKTQLLANFPNPFNPETWIPYELATDTDVKITIYTSNGVVVRTLLLGQQAAGYYTDRERAAYWDGKNAQGEQVASGVYFYQLETNTMSALRKMVILK